MFKIPCKYKITSAFDFLKKKKKKKKEQEVKEKEKKKRKPSQNKK